MKSSNQLKCKKCGSSDITFNEEKGKLICNYCNNIIEEIISKETDIKRLKGNIKSANSYNIDKTDNNLITLKCDSCGAEIVIDSNNIQSARCHWCRSVLSIDKKISNGAVPDVLLPFKVTKEEAKKQMEEYINKKKKFAHPDFINDFKLENIKGVYFPYYIIDSVVHGEFIGTGEHLLKTHPKESGETYDYESYHVERNCDVEIKGLTVESNSNRINKNRKDETNNIINSIMPFDIENCIKYRGNYLFGYTSEKRNINLNEIDVKIGKQIKTVTKYGVNEDLKYYDRGLRWDTEIIDIKGKKITTAYLPVWLYSYQEITEKEKTIHYVAVNGRTKETSGSIPVNKKKLFRRTIKIVIISSIFFLIIPLYFFCYKMNAMVLGINPMVILYGVIMTSAIGASTYIYQLSEYRNWETRHEFEKDTNKKVKITKRVDEKIEDFNRSINDKIEGCNSDIIEE